jgi:hypothetical protein
VRERIRGGFIPPVGFVDSQGNMALQPSSHDAYGFRDGLSLVTSEEPIGYINRTGIEPGRGRGGNLMWNAGPLA